MLLLTAPLPAPASQRSDAARRGAEYLVGHQAADGTFFGDDAPHRVAETLVALVAAGVGGAPVARALSATTAHGPQAADRAGEAGLLVMGLVAAGADPRDYVAHLRSFYDDRLGAYDTQQFQNALALLGVVAAGDRLPDQALTFLRVKLCPDGGIPIQVPCGAGGGHVDVTALVLQALVAHGLPPSDPLRADARSFLAAARNHEGGFGDTKGAATNANSTGLVLTAVAALGESAGDAPWDRALPLLLGLQQSDGRFRQGKAAEGDSYLATRQAVPGAAGRPLPVRPDAVPVLGTGGTTRPPAPPTTAAAAPLPSAPTAASSPRSVTAAAAGPDPVPAPAITTPTTAFRGNPGPKPRISPDNAVVNGREGRSRPVGAGAIAAALLAAVAWWCARVSRPRRHHAAAA